MADSGLITNDTQQKLNQGLQGPDMWGNLKKAIGLGGGDDSLAAKRKAVAIEQLKQEKSSSAAPAPSASPSQY